MSRYVNPVAQYLDGANSPVVNGKLFYFESEQNLAKSTFADQAETILNTNPVILDSAGRTPNIFYTGSARVVLQDAAGVQIWERDPVGDSSEFADFGQWLSYITYDVNDIVELSNNFYISKTIGNQGNDPSVSSGSNVNWTQIDLLGLFNTSTTYSVGSIVFTSNGKLWASVVNSNLNHDPLTDANGDYWTSSVDVPAVKTTTGLISSNEVFAANIVINTSGYDTAGDGAAPWKQNGVTGQTVSQSPAQLGLPLLNDGNGNQWAMSLTNTASFDTFALLQASTSGNVGQELICRERADATYIIQPSTYSALAGDATLASGLVAALQIDGWMNIQKFGAVQGVDATTEIQSAINRAEFLYAIGYDYRYTTLAVPASLKFIGAGKKQTRLRTTNLVNDKIAITSNGSHSVIFADMEFGTIGTQAGGAYLKFDSATTQLQSPLITGCNFISPYTAIYLANCGQFKLNGNYFVTYVNAGVIIDNTIEPDSGDSSIDGGNVFDAGGDTGDAIVQIASGGLRVVNNKFLNGAYHYRSAFNSSPNTSILVWAANSSEQARVANMAFTATSPTTFSYANIEGGNQFSVRDGATGVLVNDPGHNFLSSCNIGGNIFNLASNATGMNIGRLQNSTIGRNTIIGNGTGETGLITGANSSGLKISQQTMVSVATEYSLLGGYDITDWEVESGNQTGSTSNAFGSHYITPTIAVTFAKAYPIAPKVQATTVNSNGGLSSLVSNVTTSGFSLNIVGVNSAVTVTSNWTATL